LNTGYKYFDKIDWYQQIADGLVATQAADGSWGANGCNTAWALSCLALGRATVLMNKLEYSTAARAPDAIAPSGASECWNQRPWDINHLTKWFARMTRRHFNWQIVRTDMSIETLHDSPILYLSGNRALNFKPKEIALLRRYVEEGGLIVGHPNGAG